MTLQDQFKEMLRAEMAPLEAKLSLIDEKLDRLLEIAVKQDARVEQWLANGG